MSRIPFVTENTVDVASDINGSLLVADGLIASLVGALVTAPPVAPSDGDRVAILSGASGIFAAHAGQIAVYQVIGDFWMFFSPRLCQHGEWLYLQSAGTWNKAAYVASADMAGFLECQTLAAMKTYLGIP